MKHVLAPEATSLRRFFSTVNGQALILLSDHAAIDGNDLAADIGRLLRGEKAYEIGHFLGPAGPLQVFSA